MRFPSEFASRFLRVQACAACWFCLFAILGLNPAKAQETVCAKVKIEIKQQLTLERQGFDAEMKINNTTDSSAIENVGIQVRVMDEAGQLIPVTDNPNDLSAKFYVRVSSKVDIDDIAGQGRISPKTTARINWLLIPAPGAAGQSPLGKKYLVGATLQYRFNGETTTLNVDPDVITVKPLPLLSLDYFLPENVMADDPLTTEIEPVVPFSLGVRVKNAGFAVAKNLKIDSAQPKIVENKQGLLIGFKLTGSSIDDQPAQNSLLLSFGDIPANTSKSGRWVMETTLSGRFSEFTAKYSHADELGGALTSLIKDVKAHQLIGDVRVDLPGRDPVRDFLARDGDILRVYESEGMDSEVTDRSQSAQYLADGANGYRFVFAPTAGFVYVKAPDPFNGRRMPGRLLRSDGKQIAPDNIWLSQSRNTVTKRTEYWLNLFDVNSSGSYGGEWKQSSSEPRAPVWQFIPDRNVKEGKQISFIVEASSPDGKALQLSAAPLPPGASFVQQPLDPNQAGVTRAIFDWPPPTGSHGNYQIHYSATDGALSSVRSAGILVENETPPTGPIMPVLDSPALDAHVPTQTPALAVHTSDNSQDPASQVDFELYADEALSQRIGNSVQPKNTQGATAWTIATPLNDNTKYWWRARSSDGKLASSWVNGRFFVNLFNDAPDAFNLASPAPGATVSSVTPVLSWNNSSDRDGDAISYEVALYRDAGLTQRVAFAKDLPPQAGPDSQWTVNTALQNRQKYWWHVLARDSHGASTPSALRTFTVNTGNTAPGVPQIVSPAAGSQSAVNALALTVSNASDADGDSLRYQFELDVSPGFNTNAKQSALLDGAADGQTRWQVANLLENQRYWWRVKARDAESESAWVSADFMVNVANDAPPAPAIANPGDGAWSADLQPVLSATAVQDPEGEPVRYQFEVFGDARLQNKVLDGVSDNTAWKPAQALNDHTTYWWRVRALDAHDAASAWSQAATLYLSSSPYQAPGISMQSPAGPSLPQLQNGRKLLQIQWEGTDLNIEPSIALFYSMQPNTYDGVLIVDGLRQAAGVQRGSYQWDVTQMAPGTYYIYAQISNTRGRGQAYAAGALVIPPAQPHGAVLVTRTGAPYTSEAGGSVSLFVHLANAPAAEVVLPLESSNRREGVPALNHLRFTPQNWNAMQIVNVQGQNDCAPDANQAYQVSLGPAQSLDGHYMGLPVQKFDLTNLDQGDQGNTSNNPAIHLCGLNLLSEKKLSDGRYEYTLNVELSNSGAALPALVVELSTVPAGVQVVQGRLQYGAIGAGDTVSTAQTLLLRSNTAISRDAFRLAKGYFWTVRQP
ncbi:hypothetical protein V8J88_02125 [Massilia sp. W12]|uniref:hypothetical protein n=1 Tax=Massilia sp. W12 TaxID=3126507 RepID=UPI0030CD647E